MLDDQFIPKIKFNPEKVSMSTTAHNFHYINKDGKLTCPWFNFDAIQKRNDSQKNVFTFSANSVSSHLNAADKEENHDSIFESTTVVAPGVTEDTEDLLVASKSKINLDHHNKRQHRRIFENDDVNIKKEYMNESVQHQKVQKKTIKIPFSLFAKIHNFRYPPIGALLGLEEVSQSEHNLEREDVLEPETIEVNPNNELVQHLKVQKKTISIPFSLFTKIHNFRYPPIDASINLEEVHQSEHNLEREDILDSGPLEVELDKNKKAYKKTIKIPISLFSKIHKLRYPPINVPLRQEVVFQPEYNLEMKGILEQENKTDKLLKVHKNSIKIPFSLFAKIHNFRYPPIEAIKEQEKASQSEHKLENENRVDHSTIGNQNNAENDKTNHSNKISGQTETRLKNLKIPFSTFAEIENFHHFPLFGSTMQNTFKFIDPSDNKKTPQLATKLFDTTTYYQDQPYCHLIGFKSHDLIFSNNEKREGRENKNKQKGFNRAVAVPIHDSLSIKEGEPNNAYPHHKYVYTRVPVVIGEYNMEFCLDEVVLFEEKVYQVKEISKVVELTNCKFVPTKFSPKTASRERIALTGTLFIEGNIHQSIEYLAIAKEEQHLHPLHQNIVIELIIQLLQVQKVINQQ
ncbi:BC_2427 family protein [Psychrobacillus sp. NPDC096389]|uniref:BC_2427 family protein n=1 Tax=Psychrobacillus sp. NPDC096389 TaxID=3364490 RepID=UPI003812AEA3